MSIRHSALLVLLIAGATLSVPTAALADDALDCPAFESGSAMLARLFDLSGTVSPEPLTNRPALPRVDPRYRRGENLWERMNAVASRRQNELPFRFQGAHPVTDADVATALEYLHSYAEGFAPDSSAVAKAISLLVDRLTTQPGDGALASALPAVAERALTNAGENGERGRLGRKTLGLTLLNAVLHRAAIFEILTMIRSMGNGGKAGLAIEAGQTLFPGALHDGAGWLGEALANVRASVPEGVVGEYMETIYVLFLMSRLRAAENADPPPGNGASPAERDHDQIEAALEDAALGTELFARQNFRGRVTRAVDLEDIADLIRRLKFDARGNRLIGFDGPSGVSPYALPPLALQKGRGELRQSSPLDLILFHVNMGGGFPP